MSSYLLVGFWYMSSLVIIFLALLYGLSSSLPQTLQDALLFGKLHSKRRQWSILQLIEIPKRWFIHFYVIGVLVNSFAVTVMMRLFIWAKPLPDLILQVLVALDTNQQVSTDGVSAVLLIAMMLIQNSRRLCECLYVSVFSRGSINVAHYLFGVCLYSTFWIAVLVETPYRLHAAALGNMSVTITLRHIVGLLLFGSASWQQHAINLQLASVRKNDKGEVVTFAHSIPRGDWFEYVSCPHYLMEIIIYGSFTVIGGFGHVTLFSILIFVVTNQLTAALLTHAWYRREYKDYPTLRKAVVPFII